MKKALGLIEIKGLATAIVVADAMSKSANIEMIDIENTKGSGYMTIKVNGDVGAVNAAIQAGKQIAIQNGKLISSKVIARPSDYIDMFFGKKEETKASPKVEVKEEIKETPKVEAIKEPVKETIIQIKDEIVKEPIVEEIKLEEVKENNNSKKTTTSKTKSSSSKKGKK